MELQQYREILQRLQQLLNGQTIDREKADQELAKYESMIQLLREQIKHQESVIQMQKTIIEGKDQMLDLLKGGFNRPN